jgi:hypothetical protein
MDQALPAPPIIIPVVSDAHWHELRSKLLITASRVACLLTEHPYTSARREWEVALGTAKREDTIDAELAELGLDAEEVILPRLMRLRPGAPLRKNTDLFQHPSLPFGGTPDFVSISSEYKVGRCWQAKCLHPSAYRRNWLDGPPDYILLQHQAECLLTGAVEGGVVALVRDADWTTIPYDLDPHMNVMRAIEEAIEIFADAVERRTPPPINFAADARWIIGRQQVNKVFRDMTGSNLWADACARWLAAQDDMDAAEARLDTAKAEVIELVGDADVAAGHGFVVRRTQVAANPGKVVTPDMLGQIVGAKRGHVRMAVAAEVTATGPKVPPRKKVHKA